MDLQSLVVPRRPEPQLNLALLAKELDRQEEATAEVGAVCSVGVNLLGRVAAVDQAVEASPGAVAANRDYVAVARRPFALNTN
jgi:hypothetical protein